MDILIIIDNRYLGHRRFGCGHRFGSFREAPGIAWPGDDTIGAVVFA
jgi:hypothetical protein